MHVRVVDIPKQLLDFIIFITFYYFFDTNLQEHLWKIWTGPKAKKKIRHNYLEYTNINIERCTTCKLNKNLQCHKLIQYSSQNIENIINRLHVHVWLRWMTRGGGGRDRTRREGRLMLCSYKKKILSFWVWFEFSPMVVMVAQRIRPLGFVHLLLTVEIFVQAPVEISEKHGES